MDAVIFDLDDTLIAEQATARASIAEALSLVEQAGAMLAGAGGEVDTALACARRHWSASPYVDECRRLGIGSWTGLWSTFEGCHASLDVLGEWAAVYRRAAWEDILGKLGADVSLAPDVADRYVEVQRAGHPAIASAVDAARSAEARMPIGLLTNGPSDTQRLKLSRTGLEFAAEAVSISAEVGLGKPDRAAFLLVLERMGARAATTVMVGDSWGRDIVGAVNAGMRAIWVSKGRRPPAELDGVLIVEELTPGSLGVL